MSPTKAADEAANDETEHDDEHDHEHDHEHDDELSAQDELDIERLDVALTTLDDESLRRGLAGVTEKQRQELATHLNLPRATVHLGDALAPLVRRKLHGLSVERQHAVATALTNRVNDATVAALGDRSEDPSREELEEVLPAIVEEHGVELVRLMIASYAVSDAPVRPVMRELLESDERFALPEAPAGEEGGSDLPSFGLVARTTKSDDPARAEVLEKRKANKAERREAAARARKAKESAQASRREALHAAKRTTK